MNDNIYHPWEEKTISQITETLIDYRGQTPEKTDSGVLLITAKVIKDGFIQYGNNEYISEETYKTWMTRGFPQVEDIFITTEAPLGEVAQLRTNEKIAIAQRLILLRGKKKLINQKYYYYALQSYLVRKRIESYGTGTTVLGIKQKQLRKILVPLPPLPIQDNIANILSSIDNLKESNHQRIEILEKMAHLLYREWFVEFRFPGYEKCKFVDSELGKIPEGWTIGSVNDLLTIKSGFPFKSETYVSNGEYKIITIGNVGDKYFDPITNDAIESLPAKLPEYCILKNGDILISLTGNIGRVCLVYGNENYLLNQRVGKVKIKNNKYRSYVYTILNSYYLRKYLENISNGAAQQNLSPIEAGKIRIIIPNEQILSGFNDLVEPFINHIVVLNNQNLTLKNMRDLLLPKLMSGEIDVSKLDIKGPEN